MFVVLRPESTDEMQTSVNSGHKASRKALISLVQNALQSQNVVDYRMSVIVSYSPNVEKITGTFYGRFVTE